MQKEFFAMALGGPISYSGKSLAHVHHGRGVKWEHFAHFVGHLVETLKDIGISQEDADHVIEHINTLSNEITARPTDAIRLGIVVSQSFVAKGSASNPPPSPHAAPRQCRA